jgi:hypothetical protein
MPKIRTADWLLSLFTTQDVAASISGDLIEEARDRGPWWFWSHTLRTTFALCGREIVRRPDRFLTIVFFAVFSHEHALLITEPTWVSQWSWIVRVILVGRLVAPFMLGLLTAFLAGESGMAGCLAVAVIRFSLTTTQWHGKPFTWLVVTALLPAVSIVAAGVFVRLRTVA